MLHTTALLHNLSLPGRPADAPEPPPITGSAKSPQNSDFRQVWGISGTSETAARGSLVQCIGKPGGNLQPRGLPPPHPPHRPRPTHTSFTHHGSFNCNPRMGKVGKKPTTEHRKPDTWTDGQLVTGGRCCLPGQSCRVLASPRRREGPKTPETGVRVGRAAVKLPARLEEVMRQEEGPLRASPPSPPPNPSLRGQQLGPRRRRGGWDRGCHPTRFRQECGSEGGGGRKGEEGKKKKSLPRGHKIIIK